MIDLLERVALRFEREESPQQKLHKLEGFLVQYGLPLAEVVPLFAALLSLPLSADYAPLHLSPEQQKRQTLQALLTILLHIAARQPVLFVMEALHWVDPTALEFLSLLVDQGPTARILALWTFRPDFSPPWAGRSHLTQVTLHRLPRQQAIALTGPVARGKAWPREVVEQTADQQCYLRLATQHQREGDSVRRLTPGGRRKPGEKAQSVEKTMCIAYTRYFTGSRLASLVRRKRPWLLHR